MKIIHLFIATILALATACEPIEIREDKDWGNFDKSQLNFTITQNEPAGNFVYLAGNQEESGLVYWDYVLGTSNNEVDTIYFRFAGDYWIKYSVYTKQGMAIDSAKITVANNDLSYFNDPRWQLITNGVNGKTWVWAYGNKYNALTGVGPLKIDPLSWNNTNLSSGFSWWKHNYFQSKDTLSMTVVNDCEIGELTFDLDGGAHMTKSLYVSHKDSTIASSTSGTFYIDLDKNELTLAGVKILKQQPDGGTFKIVKLTEDELVLGQCTKSDWRPFYFKRKGFKFPEAPIMIWPQ